MLRILNYKKTYGSVPVLQIEKLQLTAGVYWLKGENGAGKTTVLKSIAGLVPFDGSIEVDGIDLRKQRMLYTKKVAFAEAEPTYPLFLTGRDLLAFYGKAKEGGESNMAEALGALSYLPNQVGTYSSGMLKKLSLALAFVGKPTLVLLDEPFVTLDVKAVETLRQAIAAASKNGVSFLLSSHQEPELDVPCESLCIHQGTIQREAHVAGA